MVRWPGVIKEGSVNKDFVSNLDFAQTFLVIAGVSKIPDPMQGHSLVPIFKGKTPEDWRKSFYYHYYEFPGAHSVRKHYGVVTDRYKLFHFYEPDMNYWTLIDRKQDTHEMKNVYDQPKYVESQQELNGELDRVL